MLKMSRITLLKKIMNFNLIFLYLLFYKFRHLLLMRLNYKFSYYKFCF